MSLDLRHMLKVYNYINDEKKPKVNLKFLGLFAALVVAGGALVVFAFSQEGGTAPVSATQKKSDYVGLAPDEMLSSGSPLLEQRLQSWYEAHPEAIVERVEPVYENGRLVGYRLTYTESS